MLSLEQRAPLYAFCADLLLHELDAPRFAALSQPHVCETLDRAAPGFLSWQAAGFGPAREAELRSEYARLFLLPGGTPPFASAWIDGEREALGAQLATLVTRALEALGRERVRAEPWGELPLDHAGLLFDLVVSGVEAGDAGGRAVAAHVEEEAITPWLAAFGRALAERATAPPYVALGRLLVSLAGDASAPRPAEAHG